MDFLKTFLGTEFLPGSFTSPFARITTDSATARRGYGRMLTNVFFSGIGKPSRVLAFLMRVICNAENAE